MAPKKEREEIDEEKDWQMGWRREERKEGRKGWREGSRNPRTENREMRGEGDRGGEETGGIKGRWYGWSREGRESISCS